MPRCKDIKRVLILGSGPIVIGQACEFDYSGTQACKALMQEGLEVILVNSNPATIMTDPEIATRVYIEPLKLPFLEKIIAKEKPDSVISTLGGQTALNIGLALHNEGILDKYGVNLLGISPEVICKAEDRELFKKVLDEIGARAPNSFKVKTFEQGLEGITDWNFPIILRPNFTLGGTGGGIAYHLEDFKRLLENSLRMSPTSEVLIEQSLLGWKEFELEVMRDKNGTFVVVCSIENFDPCGVHTGDSITVAPQQTLTDKEYQNMRNEARAIVQSIGLEVGGANIQFAVHPDTRERMVIEMNPRVSRSSALASKATGFPIAKISTLLAIGYSLDELKNDITQTTPGCYEPALDYIVTKVPRFGFNKFPGAKDSLNTQMKSVGEVMGIGRTFKESFQKALNAIENDGEGLIPLEFNVDKLSHPNSQRVLYLAQAFRNGMTLDEVYELTQIAPWFLEQIEDIIQLERELGATKALHHDDVRKAKRFGFSDRDLARLFTCSELEIRQFRHKEGIRPAFYKVDTCAGEFESETPYFYSTYWGHSKSVKIENSIVIIGSGPNRIGQGIEFDYGCVRAVSAYQAEGFNVIMINSNPETVSTDYDTSHALFFEPLTLEHVIEVMDATHSCGFAAQWGGQTSINLASELKPLGYSIIGSSLETIHLAEDRERFGQLCRSLNLKIPRSEIAIDIEGARSSAEEIGYPLLMRPGFVLGGQRMEVVENREELESYFSRHADFIKESSPVLIDEFLEGALEVDVDLVHGKNWSVIGGIVEHIETAGVHSGDSMGVLPPQRLKPKTCVYIEKMCLELANRLNVLGHLNLQLAVKDDQICILEANPRSSRSVPFLAKATGIPLVDLAVKASLGHSKIDQSFDWKSVDKVCVKGVVFPFNKFPEADSILGPEMKSTGESMGRGDEYSEALLKALLASQVKLPREGEVFLSLREQDKERLLPLVKELKELGYSLSATKGTAQFLGGYDIACVNVKKVYEGRPHCVDRIRSGKVAFVINTTSGRLAIRDSFNIRRSCIDYQIPCITETDAAEAFLLALKKERKGDIKVSPLSF